MAKKTLSKFQAKGAKGAENERGGKGKGKKKGGRKKRKPTGADIYNQIKVTDCSGGSYVQHALDTLVSQGIVGLNIMPYNDNECDTQPNNLQKVLAEPNKIENYFLQGQCSRCKK